MLQSCLARTPQQGEPFSHFVSEGVSVPNTACCCILVTQLIEMHPVPFLQVPAASDCTCIESKKDYTRGILSYQCCPVRILESSRQIFHQFHLIVRVWKDSDGGAEEQSRRSWTLPSALIKPYSLPWRPATPGLMLRVAVPPQLHPFPEPPGWCVPLEAPGESSLRTLLCEDCNHKQLSRHCK